MIFISQQLLLSPQTYTILIFVLTITRKKKKKQTNYVKSKNPILLKRLAVFGLCGKILVARGQLQWTLWTDHNLHPSCTADEEEAEKLGVELSLGRREGSGEGGVSFAWICCYPTLLLICNRLHNLPELESVLPAPVSGAGSPCPYPTHELFNLIFSLCLAAEGEWDQLGGHLVTAKAKLRHCCF